MTAFEVLKCFGGVCAAGSLRYDPRPNVADTSADWSGNGWQKELNRDRLEELNVA